MRTRTASVEPLSQLGLCTAAIDPRIEEIEFDDWRTSSQINAMQRILILYQKYAELEIPDARRAIEQVSPEALIIDLQYEGAAYVAFGSGLPWAQYCPYPPPLPSLDAPPRGLGLRPARGPLGHARDRFWRIFGDRLLAPRVAARNELRAGLGLPPLRAYDDQWREADRFIAFTAEPYEYARRDWPETFRLVGPGTWQPAAEPPAWIEAETRAIVLGSASSAYQRDEKLIRTALEAFAGEDVALVVTTAAHAPESLPAPSNAGSSSSCPMARSSPSPCAWSAMVAKGSPRRRWPLACQRASCRFTATSSTLHGE